MGGKHLDISVTGSNELLPWSSWQQQIWRERWRGFGTSNGNDGFTSGNSDGEWPKIG